MKSHLYHIQVNINFKNIEFYKELMETMGWEVIFGAENIIGYKSANSGDIWFIDAEKQETNDYDAYGVNHIGLRVETQNDVDTVMNHLTDNGVVMLFETPRHRPEFSPSENETYYQIMFESPDKILFEVVYIGPK